MLRNLFWVLVALTVTIGSPSAADFCKPGGGAQMADISGVIDDKFAKKITSVGVSVVARYYDYQNETIRGKRLRPEELEILRNHGLKLLVVFQHNNNRAATFLDWKSRGPADAREALKLAANFQQRPGSAIYFGVDGDFVGPGRGFYTQQVKLYFEEIQKQFEAKHASFSIGVYGSGAACDMLRGAGITRYCWLANSRGFVGTKSNLADGRYDISQFLPTTCGGWNMDFNVFKSGVAEVGQFDP